MSNPIASNSTSLPNIGPHYGTHPEKRDTSTSEQFAPQDHDDEPVAHKTRHVSASIGLPLAPQQSIADARSLATLERVSTGSDSIAQPPSSVFHPFSPAVVALLMPASIFGTLTRLGLQALATYDGKAIFPLAYPQAVGCLIMGIALPLKDTISI
jgi:hypothetical protein